jgi:hypothetical protein
MGSSKIKFGDKFFLYGQFTQLLSEFDEYEYNSAMGYMTVGGYNVIPIETMDNSASVPGFVTEILYEPSLAVAAPFSHMEMVDITGKLARDLPLPSGTKVWMPIQATVLPLTHFQLPPK